MRHKWILLMCAGVILMLVTIANPVAGFPTYGDGPDSENPRVPNANETNEINTNEGANFSTSEDTNRKSKSIYIPLTGKQSTPAITITTTTEKPYSICTKSTLNYDCTLQNIQLTRAESNNFGLTWKTNPQKNITFENSRLAYLPKKLIDAFSQMELLNAEDLQIEEIEDRAFSKAANLKQLYLQNNEISTIKGFKGAPNLVHLDLSKNRIKHMAQDAFLNSKMLERMLLNNNLISELPNTDTAENLQILDVANNEINQISDHQFSKNNKLEHLDLSFNNLNHFNLVQIGNKSLSFIDVSHNKLESLYIPTGARVLKAANNSIHVVSVNECYVERLDLSRNQITNVMALQNCNNLINLDLSHNFLQGFNLIESFRNLIYLNLAHNQLLEINFPPNFHPLQILDLSFNQLSYGPVNKFKQMKTIKLNDNKFIEFRFDNMNQLHYIEMSNNKWDCGRINNIMKQPAENVADAKEVCRGTKSLHGICCKDYKRAFNDRLKEIVQETFVHEKVNEKEHENCKLAKPSSEGVEKQDIQSLQAKAAKLDDERKEIFEKIDYTHAKNAEILTYITASKSRKTELNKKLENYNRVVHKLREHYGVINEGLISTNLTLNRVLQFTQERNVLSKDLLARRVQEVQDTQTRLNNLTDMFTTVSDENKNLRIVLTTLKTNESAAKKEKQLLEKAANRNSPSVHGSKG